MVKMQLEDIIRLFVDNGIEFCVPHGIKNDALMNAYIFAKDLDKVKKLLNGVSYDITPKDDNFVISIM